jgi:hypothetical protein
VAASVIKVGCPRLSARDFSAIARPIRPFPSSKGCFQNRDAQRRHASMREAAPAHPCPYARTTREIVSFPKELATRAAHQSAHAAQHPAERRYRCGTVSRRVGYESQPQFSREYSRLFGKPPMQEISAGTSLRK